VSQPREFWILKQEGAKDLVFQRKPFHHASDELIHVIEKSAYDELKAFADEQTLRANDYACKLDEKHAENDALKAENERLNEQVMLSARLASKDQAKIDKLAEQVKVLSDALIDAVDTIHGEFCGSGRHHDLCSVPSEALEKVRGMR